MRIESCICRLSKSSYMASSNSHHNIYHANIPPIPESGYVTPYSKSKHHWPTNRNNILSSKNEREEQIKKINHRLLSDAPKLSSQVRELVCDMKRPPSRNASRQTSRGHSKSSSLCSQTNSNSLADTLSEKSFTDLADRDPFHYPGLFYKKSQTRSHWEGSANSKPTSGASSKKISTSSYSGHNDEILAQEEYRKWYSYMKSYERFYISHAVQVAAQFYSATPLEIPNPSVSHQSQHVNQKFHEIYFKSHFRSSFNSFNCIVTMSTESSSSISIEQFEPNQIFQSTEFPITIENTQSSDVLAYLQSERSRLESELNFQYYPLVVDSLVLLEYLFCLVLHHGQPSAKDVVSFFGCLLSKYSSFVSKEPSITSRNNKTICTDNRDELVNRFRNLLLRGHRQEALDYACSKQLWEFAFSLVSGPTERLSAERIVKLFLSSSLDSSDLIVLFHKASNGETLKFTEQSTENGSLAWLSYLMMLLSNKDNSERKENWNYAIENLSNSLFHERRYSAAHLCLLCVYGEDAFIDFSDSAADATVNQINLLGLNIKLNNQEISSQKHNVPTILAYSFDHLRWTEVFEYALSMVRPGFTLPVLQIYRLNAAANLLEQGSVTMSQAYLEAVEASLGKISPPPLAQFITRAVSHLMTRMKEMEPSITRSNNI